MPPAILATKLYTPPPRTKVVSRSRLFDRLRDGLNRKLTLVSAPAGFGKTTLVSEWIANCDRPTAWLSLDEGDSDPARFLTYFIAALQTIAPTVGDSVLAALGSPQPPPPEALLTALINAIAAIPVNFILVLDDYHTLDSKPVDDALAFLLDHLPSRMHLVIATREDPPLPLARLRARGQLTELRVTDLRFTLPETADFLAQVMELRLAADEVTALEARTEGWIAGLQLAAISMQGHHDAAAFIKSFTGSHRFILDYLLEEVLQQQPDHIQTFLLHTAILDRLCGSLCDAVLGDPAGNGQQTLEYLERANLFIIPLDNERRWYRYHHLFGDLLRQRLSAGSVDVAQLHSRASNWFEENGLEMEAFHHAGAAGDIDHAARLLRGKGMPLHFRGGAAPVLKWLNALPRAELDARPELWVSMASALLFVNRTDGVAETLLTAEATLQNAEENAHTRDLIGHIALMRATLAVMQHDFGQILDQSNRALAYLHPDNLPVRTATLWTLGYAYQLQGDRAAAIKAFTEAVAISHRIGHYIIEIMANIGLGNMQEAQNQLELAAQTYRHIIDLAGDPPNPVACEAHLGLARVHYEWNDLDAARQHSQRTGQLARNFASTDRAIAGEVVRARILIAEGDFSGAESLLAEIDPVVRQHQFTLQIPEIANARVIAFLRQGDVKAAQQAAEANNLPLGLARVRLAQGDAAGALAALEPARQMAEAKNWVDLRLKVMVLTALALYANRDLSASLQQLRDALTLAQPGGFVRIFLDEGAAMARLLSEAAARGILPDYTAKLLAALEGHSYAPPAQPLIDPLSDRELEVLRLIAEGLSNEEIGERLFLALSTVKGHNRNIFDKLSVQRRTEAVARARELGLL